MATHIFGTRTRGQAMRFVGEFEDKVYQVLVRERLPPGWAAWHSDSTDYEQAKGKLIITRDEWSIRHDRKPAKSDPDSYQDPCPILRELAVARELARLEAESPYGLCRVCGKVVAAGLYQGLYRDSDGRRRPYRGYVDEQCADQMAEDTGHRGRWSTPAPKKRGGEAVTACPKCGAALTRGTLEYWRGPIPKQLKVTIRWLRTLTCSACHRKFFPLLNMPEAVSSEPG